MLMKVYISKSVWGRKKESANTMRRNCKKSEIFAEQICLEIEFILCTQFFK